MGYLTTINLYNDSVHSLKDLTPEEAKQFCNKVYAAVCESSIGNPVTVSLKGHVNFMTVFPSRHADDHTIYVNMGNCLTEVIPWSDKFKEQAEKHKSFYEHIYNFLKSETSQLKKVLGLK
jgi:hypothetical protein